MDTTTDLNQPEIFTPEHKEFVENNGYLLIKNALPPDVVAEIDAAVDEVYAEEEDAGRLGSWRKIKPP